MQQKIIHWFFLLLFTQSLFAQKSIVFGLVKDLDSNEGIEYANVVQLGTNNGIESDINGQYRLEIPANQRLVLRFSRVGYNDLDVTIDNVPSGQKRNINVKMVVQSLDVGVTIRSGRVDDVGMVREEVTELKILPTASGNFESILPHIALGVNAGSGGELTSQYNVRGGNYDENLIYVNDFEIFRPQLIRSGQQEGLSFPNIDLIRDLEFSSGGFESRFGDKMSSVLDIRYKRPDEFKMSATASFLGASVHVEGSKRLGANAYNKLRYLIGARYKSNAYLLGSAQVKGEFVPSFTDIQGYLSYDITKNLQVGLISNYNGSKYDFVPSSGKSKQGTIGFQIELNTAFDGREVDVFKYGMSGLSFTYLPEKAKNPWFMKLLASYYRSSEDESIDIIGTYRLAQIETAIGKSTGKEIAVLGTGTQHLYARNNLFNTISNLELKGGREATLERQNNARQVHFTQWGAKIQREFFDDYLNEWERIDSAGYSLFDRRKTSKDITEVDLFKVSKSVNIIDNIRSQAYLQHSITFANKAREIKFMGGLRATHRSLSNELLLSPRGQIYYKPLGWKRDFTFKLAGGIYHQLPFYRELRNADGALNTSLKSQKSLHIVGGLTYDFTWERISNRPFKIISEVYYKKLTNLISYEVDNVRIRYSGLNNSTGYVTGVDFRINGEFVKNAESWVNLSFLRARESINGIAHKGIVETDTGRVLAAVKDVPRPTDQLMTLNMFFQDYLPSNENIKVNLNFSYGTGLPFGPRENNLELRNFYRLRKYHRIDIGFSFQLWKKEWLKKKPNHVLRFAENSWLSIEAFNLLKISNQASVNWIKTLTNDEYALPNNLTGRRINLRLRIDI
jgi:hypothetical protein